MPPEETETELSDLLDPATQKQLIDLLTQWVSIVGGHYGEEAVPWDDIRDLWRRTDEALTQAAFKGVKSE